jgi:hypothetical protein
LGGLNFSKQVKKAKKKTGRWGWMAGDVEVLSRVQEKRGEIDENRGKSLVFDLDLQYHTQARKHASDVGLAADLLLYLRSHSTLILTNHFVFSIDILLANVPKTFSTCGARLTLYSPLSLSHFHGDQRCAKIWHAISSILTNCFTQRY